MSGMIWDEVQRLRAALHSLDSDLQERYAVSCRWGAVIEAVSALEAAIAEAWPPPKPDLLPGVLATTAAQDVASTGGIPPGETLKEGQPFYDLRLDETRLATAADVEEHNRWVAWKQATKQAPPGTLAMNRLPSHEPKPAQDEKLTAYLTLMRLEQEERLKLGRLVWLSCHEPEPGT